jgi:putative hydrolase of the HAD superfamily
MTGTKGPDGAGREPGGSAITAVLWDFGGVLTTSPFDAFAAYESAHALEPGFIRRLNAINPDANAWAGLERGHVTLDEFVTLFEDEAARAGARVDARAIVDQLSGELRPAMVEALRRCHERLKTGLLTNNFNRGGEEPSARHAGVIQLFDVVIESSKAGCRKPDILFYEMACELLEIEPRQAVFLDDLGVNLKPARAMGMRTIKVADPTQAISELQTILGFPLADGD